MATNAGSRHDGSPALNAITPFHAHAVASDRINVSALALGLRARRLNPLAAASGDDPAEAVDAAVRLPVD